MSIKEFWSGVSLYGQIGDQTGLFYTTNPVFYTSGNRFVHRTGTFRNLIFSLVPSDNCNTKSTCPTSVFTGIGQTLMSRPDRSSLHFVLVQWFLAELWSLVLFSCHHFISLGFEILTWFLVWECIIISYRSNLKFVPIEWFLTNLQPLGFEIWPNI